MNGHSNVRTELEARGFFHIRPGLKRMSRLSRALGYPERRFAAIHIAGTNGKGSVAAMIERVLREAGFRTGLYTSPHLSRLEERIQLSGRPISAGQLDRVLQRVRHQEYASQVRLTYFEWVTLAAFLAFESDRTEVAVVECGMGGRWDATNILPRPAMAIITSIGLDHERWLGSTEEAIAGQKAGILKPGGMAVDAAGHYRAIELALKRNGSRVARAERDFRGRTRRLDWSKRRHEISVALGRRTFQFQLALMGRHQAANAATAITALSGLRDHGWDVSEEALRDGLAQVQWPGRLEWFHLPQNTDVLLDGAHNPHGISALTRTLKDRFFRERRIRLVFGAMADKNVERMATLLAPHVAEVHLALLPHERSASREQLERAFAPCGGSVRLYGRPLAALRSALASAGPKDLVLVAGSLSLIGAIRPWLNQFR